MPSTVLGSSRRHYFATNIDGEFTHIADVIAIVRNLTGFNLKDSGDINNGYRGLIIDEGSEQPTHSRLRGLILSGGDGFMRTAIELADLTKTLGITSLHGVPFQLLAFPKSIDNDSTGQSLGHRTAVLMAGAAVAAAGRWSVANKRSVVIENGPRERLDYCGCISYCGC